MQNYRILCHAFLGNLTTKKYPPVFNFFYFPPTFSKRHMPPAVNGVDAPETKVKVKKSSYYTK